MAVFAAFIFRLDRGTPHCSANLPEGTKEAEMNEFVDAVQELGVEVEYARFRHRDGRRKQTPDVFMSSVSLISDGAEGLTDSIRLAWAATTGQDDVEVSCFTRNFGD